MTWTTALALLLMSAAVRAGQVCDEAVTPMMQCFKEHLESDEHQTILRSLEVTPFLPLASALPLLCSNRETFFAYLTCSKTALRRCPGGDSLPNVAQERLALNDLCHKLHRVNLSCVQERTAECRQLMTESGHMSVEDNQVFCRSFSEVRRCSRNARGCVEGEEDVFDSYFQAVVPPTCSAPLPPPPPPPPPRHPPPPPPRPAPHRLLTPRPVNRTTTAVMMKDDDDDVDADDDYDDDDEGGGGSGDGDNDNYDDEQWTQKLNNK